MRRELFRTCFALIMVPRTGNFNAAIGKRTRSFVAPCTMTEPTGVHKRLRGRFRPECMTGERPGVSPVVVLSLNACPGRRRWSFSARVHVFQKKPVITPASACTWRPIRHHLAFPSPSCRISTRCFYENGLGKTAAHHPQQHALDVRLANVFPNSRTRHPNDQNRRRQQVTPPGAAGAGAHNRQRRAVGGSQRPPAALSPIPAPPRRAPRASGARRPCPRARRRR